MSRTIPFFFGIIKIGAANVESLFFFSTPSLHNRSSSFSEFPHESWQLEKPCGALVLHPSLVQDVLAWYGIDGFKQHINNMFNKFSSY